MSLSHLQTLLHERRDAFFSAANTTHQLMSSFETTILGIASTLSILDGELEKCGTGTVAPRFTFRNKAKYLWDEPLLRQLSQQIRDQRSSIGFLVSCMQMEKFADFQLQMQQHSLDLLKLQQLASNARSLRNSRIRDKVQAKSRDVDLESILSRESEEAHFHIELLNSGPYQKVKNLQPNVQPDVELQELLRRPMTLTTTMSFITAPENPVMETSDIAGPELPLQRVVSAETMKVLEVKPRWIRLHNAITRNDLMAVKDALNGEPVPIEKSGKVMTGSALYHRVPVLAQAAILGRLEIVRMLIQHDAEVGAATDTSATALIWASAEGHVEIVELLLDHGASSYQVDPLGETALHKASLYGKLDVLRALLTRGASVDPRNKHGDTPLSKACSRSRMSCIPTLIDHGAAVVTRDNYGSTPLHKAAMRNNGSEVVVQLLKSGARHTIDEYDNTEGWTPLHYAASGGHETVVEVLLENGAKIDILGSRKDHNHTPLWCAILEDKYHAASVLLEKGASQAIRFKTWAQHPSPLHHAALKGRMNLRELLPKYGGDVDVEDNEKMTPLHYAAALGCAETVRLLLKHNASINKKDDQGCTALHQALLEHRFKVATLLISNGANVNCRGVSGVAPLHIAARQGSLELVEELFSKGADRKKKADFGHC